MTLFTRFANKKWHFVQMIARIHPRKPQREISERITDVMISAISAATLSVTESKKS